MTFMTVPTLVQMTELEHNSATFGSSSGEVRWGNFLSEKAGESLRMTQPNLGSGGRRMRARACARRRTSVTILQHPSSADASSDAPCEMSVGNCRKWGIRRAKPNTQSDCDKTHAFCMQTTRVISCTETFDKCRPIVKSCPVEFERCECTGLFGRDITLAADCATVDSEEVGRDASADCSWIAIRTSQNRSSGKTQGEVVSLFSFLLP